MKNEQAAPAAPMWRASPFFRREGDALRCTLCPHACLFHDNRVGLCGTRRRREGVIETTTYGVTVTHLDRIEKKPFYHFHPTRQVLTIGTAGCSFACSYCQNFRLSQMGKTRSLPVLTTPLDPAALVEEAIAHHAIIGVSYAEPSLATELTLEIAALASRVSIPVVWKTNGFITREILYLVIQHLGAVNIDIKTATDKAHRELTGAPIGPVLDAFHLLVDSDVWLEVSTPVIPGVNADRESLTWIAETIAAAGRDIPWHLGRFNPDFRMGHDRPTSPSELEMAADIGKKAGLSYVYVERSSGTLRNTYCPGCDALVVERDIWNTVAIRLNGHACPRCGTRISGRW